MVATEKRYPDELDHNRKHGLVTLASRSKIFYYETWSTQ